MYLVNWWQHFLSMFTCCTICWLSYRLRQEISQHLAHLVYSEVYWIQIISQMFCGDPQAMNLGNEVKKKKETQILGRFGRKKLVVSMRTLTSHLLLFLQLFFLSFLKICLLFIAGLGNMVLMCSWRIVVLVHSLMYK